MLPFIGRVFDEVAGNKGMFATDVAKGVAATLPNVAGAVLGAFARTLPGDTERKDFAFGALSDTRLAKAQSAIAGAIAHEVTGDRTLFATNLLGAFTVAKQTLTLRAAIASGVIRNVIAADVPAVIDAALAGKTLAKNDFATFAGAAAVGTGELAGEVVSKVAAKFFAQATPAMFATAGSVMAGIGKAVIKSIAVSAPEAAFTVAQKVVDAGGTLFVTNAQLTTLAQALALSVPTNGPVTGLAVAGVATKLPTQNLETLAALGDATVVKAPKASLSIAQHLAAQLVRPTTIVPEATAVAENGGVVPNGPDYAGFAAKMALGSKANAPAIAAGVAVTAIFNSTETNGQSSAPEAGDIVAAVANAAPDKSLQSKLLTIAGSVALAVDVERISDIAHKAGSLLGTDTKFPKLTSIGTLATSLAKAINTKSGVSTAERVDELGEVAAELTRQAIVRAGGTTATQAALQTAISSVGTSIMKGLSASLLMNGGSFAADLKDATEEIAGAIAQTTSLAVTEIGLSTTLAAGLLDGTGVLAKALAKQAKTFGSMVAPAFTKVLGAAGQTDRLYVDTSPTPQNEPVSNANSGGSISGSARYEIGSVIDPRALIPAV